MTMFLGKPAEQFLTISNCLQSFKHDILCHDIWYLNIFTSFSQGFQHWMWSRCFVVFISLKKSKNFKFCLSVCLSVSQSVSQSVCLSVCLPVCLSICLSVCPSISLPICLPAYRSICLLVYSTWWFKAWMSIFFLFSHSMCTSFHPVSKLSSCSLSDCCCRSDSSWIHLGPLSINCLKSGSRLSISS